MQYFRTGFGYQKLLAIFETRETRKCGNSFLSHCLSPAASKNDARFKSGQN